MSESKNILLVDDNPKYLNDALPYYGYNVTAVTDGVQALRYLKKNSKSVDLILLDVMMPNMNGWETLKAIRHDRATEHTPVIMITAVNEDQKMISGLRNGADDYIVKPFILPNLLARIEAVLRRCEWQSQSKNKTPAENTEEPEIPLTSRETEILKLVLKGASNKEIADTLVVKEVTVKTHLNSVFKKLKVTSRTQAVLKAMQMDI